MSAGPAPPAPTTMDTPMPDSSPSPALLAYRGERAAPVRPRRGTRLAALAVLALLAGGGAFVGFGRAPAPPAAPPPLPPQVTVATPLRELVAAHHQLPRPALGGGRGGDPRPGRRHADADRLPGRADRAGGRAAVHHRPAPLRHPPGAGAGAAADRRGEAHPRRRELWRAQQLSQTSFGTARERGPARRRPARRGRRDRCRPRRDLPTRSSTSSSPASPLPSPDASAPTSSPSAPW